MFKSKVKKIFSLIGKNIFNRENKIFYKREKNIFVKGKKNFYYYKKENFIIREKKIRSKFPIGRSTPIETVFTVLINIVFGSRSTYYFHYYDIPAIERRYVC